MRSPAILNSLREGHRQRSFDERSICGTSPMEAIRDAARRLGTRDLSGHTMFSSSRPCPMCEAAAYWANLSAMVYGKEGSEAGPPRLCG
jgi:tRNA(Arg) A34 adenosine deaminase TadA